MYDHMQTQKIITYNIYMVWYFLFYAILILYEYVRARRDNILYITHACEIDIIDSIIVWYSFERVLELSTWKIYILCITYDYEPWIWVSVCGIYEALTPFWRLPATAQSAQSNTFATLLIAIDWQQCIYINIWILSSSF